MSVISNYLMRFWDKKMKENNAQELAFWGLRFSIGILFVTVGLDKFNESFAKYLLDIGLPLELQIPIALAECIGGILLILGFMTRISAGVLATIMLGAIIIKQISLPFEIATIEMDLILLSVCILILVVGSGKVSLAKKIENIPNILN